MPFMKRENTNSRLYAGLNLEEITYTTPKYYSLNMWEWALGFRGYSVVKENLKFWNKLST